MEVLAAIGLAGNIVQFVSFTSETLSKSREIYLSASGTTEEYTDLKVISQDLLSLKDRISSQKSAMPSLSPLVDRCMRIADEILSAVKQVEDTSTHGKSSTNSTVNGFKGTGSKSRTQWKSFRKALKCVWGKHRVQDLETRLENLRGQILFHLMSDNSNGQTHLLRLLKDWFKRDANSNDEARADMQSLTTQLSTLQKELNARHDLNNDNWSWLRDQLRDVPRAKEITKTNSMIRGLRYEYMEVRHHTIKEAHKMTFDWIYSPEGLVSHDPRSKIEYKSWLESDQGIYWVTGKPGSGKSTLMKYLDDNAKTIHHLRSWSADKPLVKASFYFWQPGTEMQKSLHGLLQSLLFNILAACPALAASLCPDKWKLDPDPLDVSYSTWSLSELRYALTTLVELESVPYNFYFHVDGLDEYTGDHWEVIDILQDLARASHVKLCISSRPWNCFQDAFGQAGSNLLRLHELTREDIEMFARDNLIKGYHAEDFMQLPFQDLLLDIANRAQGVFLWVRLVVRSLRDGITNADSISLLKERLHELPTDLEEFFEHILRSVDSVYQVRMAQTFLVALAAKEPLNVIQYSFLDEEDPNFGLQLSFELFTVEEISYRVAQTQRRLNGRYKGLLEPGIMEKLGQNTPVDFLHRTLRDFLKRGQAERLLQSIVPAGFDTPWALCRALLAYVKFIIPEPQPSDFAPVMDMATKFAEDSVNSAILCRIADHVERSWSAASPCTWMNKPKHRNFILKAAIHTRNVEYVGHRLHKQHPKRNLDDLLMHSALCMALHQRTLGEYLRQIPNITTESYLYCFDDHTSNFKAEPNIDIVNMVLSQGANPNAVVGGLHIWRRFLGNMVQFMDDPAERDSWWRLFELFIQHGADITQHTEVWVKMLTRKKFCADHILRNTARVFKLLLTHGLQPNVAHSTLSVWDAFINLIIMLSPNVSCAAILEVLDMFLERGADFSRIYVTRYKHGSLLSSWLDMMLQSVAPHHVEEYECSSGMASTQTSKLMAVQRYGPQSWIQSRSPCQQDRRT
ncbi:hypothetical protein K491DRAFT_515569 [Lophiostoma macrostomum CBS 122681]|uniref:NACHT domain-containing protein n=1 Tax=Lophiostoma macrostomum CBS 122681 TaxID=1314788 RepID=A0A6A6T3C8_9PLEO|nr:hypothetical protein K491DRAFT_515569 [Lophiostoma macrostomum CBS 122681]